MQQYEEAATHSDREVQASARSFGAPKLWALDYHIKPQGLLQLAEESATSKAETASLRTPSSRATLPTWLCTVQQQGCRQVEANSRGEGRQTALRAQYRGGREALLSTITGHRAETASFRPWCERRGRLRARTPRMEQLVLDLTNPQARENALLELSKKRESFPELAPHLWHSFGTVSALLQEIVAIYPLLSPPSLTAHASNRVCNALALLQCVASHPETRSLFLQGALPGRATLSCSSSLLPETPCPHLTSCPSALEPGLAQQEPPALWWQMPEAALTAGVPARAAYIPMFLYPFLNTVSKTRPFEYLRLTSLGVIGALVKVRPGGAARLQHAAVLARLNTAATLGRQPWLCLCCPCLPAGLPGMQCYTPLCGAGCAGPAPPLLSPIRQAGAEGCRALRCQPRASARARQVDDTDVIAFLLSTEIIPLCLRTMQMGSELSKTVATFIVQKILLDNVRTARRRAGAECVCHALMPGCQEDPPSESAGLTVIVHNLGAARQHIHI